PIEKDPGVVSVKKIYTYYKQQNIPTQVMGASFRSIDQVLGLAGCDLLTISPSLLTQLEQDTRTVDAALDANKAKQAEAIVRP
ncbi:transaldolase family protein, partial [Acinetobacter variabilis]